MASTITIDGITFSTVEDQALKSEMTLQANAFKTSQQFTDYIALAMKIQNLFLMEPGTNPANVSMGIGIRNYLMEFNDSDTMSDLQQIAMSQVNKYLPTNEIKNIEFISNPDSSDPNKLIVVFYLKNNPTQMQRGAFALSFNNDMTKTEKTVSQIFI